MILSLDITTIPSSIELDFKWTNEACDWIMHVDYGDDHYSSGLVCTVRGHKCVLDGDILGFASSLEEGKRKVEDALAKRLLTAKVSIIRHT